MEHLVTLALYTIVVALCFVATIAFVELMAAVMDMMGASEDPQITEYRDACRRHREQKEKWI